MNRPFIAHCLIPAPQTRRIQHLKQTSLSLHLSHPPQISRRAPISDLQMLQDPHIIIIQLQTCQQSVLDAGSWIPNLFLMLNTAPADGAPPPDSCKAHYFLQPHHVLFLMCNTGPSSFLGIMLNHNQPHLLPRSGSPMWY